MFNSKVTRAVTAVSLGAVIGFTAFMVSEMRSTPDEPNNPMPEADLGVVETPIEEVQPEPTPEPEEIVLEAEPEVFYELSEEERYLVEHTVMRESGYESYEGQMLVAQCMLNACIMDDIRPAEVVVKYQYAGKLMTPNESVKEAVSAVFDRGETIVDEPILWFYAPKYCTSDWHESQRWVITEGGHRFFAPW